LSPAREENARRMGEDESFNFPSPNPLPRGERGQKTERSPWEKECEA